MKERAASPRTGSGIPLRRQKASWFDWTRGSRPEPAPLSAAQRRFWILQQLDPSSTVFSRPLALRLHGELDRSALQSAINEIVRRHEALRTVFQERGGGPCQMVLPAAGVVVEFQDLGEFPVERRDSELGRIAAEQANCTFDLENGPVLRVKLFRSAEREHMLLVLMHHIIFDGWSETIFVREFRELYSAFARGQAPSLAQPAIQYADFAAWQQQRLEQGEFSGQIAYWRSELDGIPSSLSLPADHSRHGELSSASGVSHLDLPASLTHDLKQLSRDERVTLFMTLLAAFQFLLAYHADQEDIVVGVPVAGRTRVETEELIGCFMNVLVLRASLRGNPTVRELLAQVRETALRAYANQEAPIEKIVEELHPERRADQWPLFQVMFHLRNLPRLATPLADELSVELFKIDAGGIGGLDLDLEIEERQAGLRCSLRYDSARFGAATADRMLQRFQNVLQAIVREPERCVWELPVLGETERQRLLVEWNDAATAVPADCCIHELFESQVEKTPDAIAVVFEGQRLTYRELNRRSNQLAHTLRKLGAGPDELVGICLERSLEMVVGLLGILKAGAAYLPFDPDYPRERFGFLVEDARVKILLTQQSLAERVEAEALQILCLDDGERIRQENDQNLAPPSARNLAYVIYTSGSTGRPKGVMIEHRSACNHLLWRKDYYQLTAEDRFLQQASVTFDDSVWEFFAPLVVGARLVMMRPGGQLDSAYVVDLMRNERVTFACFVPSMLRVVLQESRISECDSLRWIETGGEVLPEAVQELCLAKTRAGLSNGYGPTEATVACTYFHCTPESKIRPIPIGRPVANTQIYILGRHRQLLPIGAAGELCVGGAGLARGYLHRPELTQDKFIADPFGPEPGNRLYRTGDLARYLADGNIEFLGRVDHQVKVRGFRIELEEVEAVLRQHPLVQEAAVTARQDEAGDTMLVGYCVTETGRGSVSEDLREFLGKKLPDYMVPTLFVELDSLPHLTSGKIDRAALPAPQRAQSKRNTEDAAPQTPTEQETAQIWSNVLRVATIGRNDDFFELGGHSLSAARVMQGVRQTFQVKVRLLDLFRYPTVAGMAALIDYLVASKPARAE